MAKILDGTYYLRANRREIKKIAKLLSIIIGDKARSISNTDTERQMVIGNSCVFSTYDSASEFCNLLYIHTTPSDMIAILRKKLQSAKIHPWLKMKLTSNEEIDEVVYHMATVTGKNTTASIDTTKRLLHSRDCVFVYFREFKKGIGAGVSYEFFKSRTAKEVSVEEFMEFPYVKSQRNGN